MLVSEPVFSSKLQRLSCHRKQPVGICIWQATDDQCGWKAFWRSGQDSVCTYVQYKYVPEQFRRQTNQHSKFPHTYTQFINCVSLSVKTKCHLLFSHVLQKFKKNIIIYIYISPHFNGPKMSKASGCERATDVL